MWIVNRKFSLYTFCFSSEDLFRRVLKFLVDEKKKRNVLHPLPFFSIDERILTWVDDLCDTDEQILEDPRLGTYGWSEWWFFARKKIDVLKIVKTDGSTTYIINERLKDD